MPATVPRTALAAEILRRLRDTLPPAGDRVRAEKARAYMRDQFPFLGIASPRLTELTREVLAGLAAPDQADLVAVALGCWRLREREYQYVACRYLRRYVRVCSAEFVHTVRHLIVTKSWWDTVDTLATHTLGPLIARHAELASMMDTWVADENIWLVRAAILHQLTYRSGTDTDRLFRYCTAQSAHRDFFVRKAIGWALRSYAYTDPEAVRTYVRAHEPQLSALSIREALKNL